MIGVKLKVSGISEIINVLGRYEAELPACISRAINRSLEMAKTEQIRKTTESYFAQKSKLLSSVNIFKTSKSNLTGSIISSGRVIGLDHFRLNPKTRKKGKIVQVAVKKDGLKSLPNAFIAYHSGKLGAFERTGRFITKNGRKRETIKRLMSVSAPQMLGNLSILEYLQGYADEKFRMRLEHEIDRVIGL
ncbi:hypothetical protein [Fusobacterium animalis]|uniref:hypothetical protein n=1 Tax=Fusobacterium animalis TaxID=76859 RepID=UPI0034DF2FB0